MIWLSKKIDIAKGQVYNLGGGPVNVMSIWAEFAPKLEKMLDKTLNPARGDWRPGDQRVFYADVSKAKKELGWEPKVSVDEGVQMLFDWVNANKALF